jgi:hypothetical protein
MFLFEEILGDLLTLSIVRFLVVLNGSLLEYKTKCMLIIFNILKKLIFIFIFIFNILKIIK